MKLKQWLYGAAALAMLVACSDKDIAPGGDGDDNDGKENPVSGYIAVQINLPQETGTRTEENDQFNDGTGNEYKVEDAMIILFKGTASDGEKKAKFYRAQELKKPFTTNDKPTDNITSSYIAAIPVTSTSTGNFWGMVILNGKKNNVTISKDANGNPTLTFQNIRTTTIGEDGVVSITSATKVMTTDNTFEDFLKLQTTAPLYDNSGTSPSYFFMTNTPLSNKPGGVVTEINNPGTNPGIQYLTNLGNQTYDTAEEARTHVSGCIYVERAVAKVTYQDTEFQLKTPSGENVINLKFYDAEGKETTVPKINNVTVKYALTHTNKVSNIVRNVDFNTSDHFNWNIKTENNNNISYYRMISSEPMPALKDPFHKEKKYLYRTYWCEDPNYGTGMGDDQNVLIQNPNSFNDLDKPLYCNENTFDVKHQNYGNTTIAIFEVNFDLSNDSGSDGNLYTKGYDTSKIYVTKESVMAEELSRIYSDSRVVQALRDARINNPSADAYNPKDFVEITYSTLNNVLLITGINFKMGKDGSKWFDASSAGKFNASLTKEVKTEIIEFANASYDVTVYAGGVSYYPVPIKHFGDFYTPWDKTKNTGTTTEEVYSYQDETADHANKYLGRYGMVRNNWYDLKITKIESLGYASVKDIEDKPDLSDDNNEKKQYFAVEIHILSWAKRTQNVDF